MVVTLVFPLWLPPGPPTPGPGRTCAPDGGADYLFTCPHGPDWLTSSSQLISSRRFNINPEGQNEPTASPEPTHYGARARAVAAWLPGGGCPV